MTDTPAPEPAVAPAPQTPPPRLDLPALYPACFDWTAPRPLKLGIHRDLIAAGHPSRVVRAALGVYCSRRAYLKTLRAGVPRLDLQGQPAGAVTADEAAEARARLFGTAPKTPRPPASAIPDLPADAPLTQENIVSGRLELTVKFSQLPQPVAVKTGMKIGIQTETALVVVTLPPKAWKKLEQAARDWPQWVASVTGRLGASAGAEAGTVVVLEQPAVQVFEKKAKATA